MFKLLYSCTHFTKSFKLGFSSIWTDNFQDVQAGFQRGKGNRDQIADIRWILEKARELKKTSVSSTTLKPLTLWIITNCGIFLKRWEYQTTLPVSWETSVQVKKQQLEPDMEQWTSSKLGKEYVKAIYCHPALFNLYEEYVIQNAGLEESQAGIKTASRNLRYADDTTLMAENKEKLKSLLMTVKEESEKNGLKLNIQKTKIVASCPITSWQVQFSSVPHSCLTLRLHGLQHTRPPCPSPTPRACSNSCPSSQWCHPTISSSVIPFSSCLQSFPASGSFPVSQFFTSGGQSIGASASASVLPINIQDWFPLGFTGLISLQSKGLSRVFSNTQFKSINSLVLSFLYSPNSHIHTWPLEKP